MKYSRQSHKTIYLYSCHVYKIRPKLCWLDASVIRLFWDRSKEVTEHLYSWTKYAFVSIKHSLNHKNWSEQHALQNPGMLGKWAFSTVIIRKHQLSIYCEVYTQSHTRPNTLSISSPLIGGGYPLFLSSGDPAVTSCGGRSCPSPHVSPLRGAQTCATRDSG